MLLSGLARAQVLSPIPRASEPATSQAASENAMLRARLVAALERLYLATPEPERSARAASLLADDLADVRRLGFELVTRELAGGRPVGAEVGQAALTLLAHDEAATRVRAALLVDRLDPPGAREGVVAALRSETDAAAAGALLDALARRPSRDGAAVALAWFENGPGTFEPASAAVWALARTGQLTHDERTAVLARVRALDAPRLTPACVQIAAQLGDASDRERLVPILGDARPEMRRAAATALIGHASVLGALVHAAEGDPSLFTLAARAVLVVGPTSEWYQKLRELPAPNSTAKDEGLAMVASGLSATELLTIARSTPDRSRRESLLGQLIARDRVLWEGSSPHASAAIVEGAFELATMRLDESVAGDAFAALDAVRPIIPAAARERHASLEATALLMLGRVELASGLGAPASAWIGALDRVADPGLAGEIADATLARFGSTMSDDQLRRVLERRRAADGERTAAHPGPGKP